MSTAQAQRALRRANLVRLERTTYRNELRTAESLSVARARAAELILDPPDCLATMRVAQLLMCCRSMGRALTLKTLRRVELSEFKTIGALTERQRQVLAEELRGEATDA